MRDRISENRGVWLAVGLFAGLGISYFWPHEPALAVATDRDEQFLLATCPVSPVDPIEALFVVDFLTGNLKGAVLNRTSGKFTAFYERNLAVDFQVDPKLEPHYAVVTGQAQLPGGGGVTMSSSVVYVGELTTGKVMCYAFPWKETRAPVRSTLAVIDGFQFRQPAE